MLIAGFVVDGPPGTTEQVLIRGVGPSLSQFNVAGALAQPVLTVFDSSGKLVATNTAWNTNSNSAAIVAAESTVGAFALPLDSADSALLLNLPAGSYTAQVTGLNNTTGVALAEVYEVQAGFPELINISTRASVSTGSGIAIAGFVISGSQPVRVLMRGVGPTLASFGVSESLSQPSIGLYDSKGALIATDTGWSSPPTAGNSTSAIPFRQATAADLTSAGAFALPNGSADSAMVATLPPGSYTLQLSGANGSTGEGLVEVYLLP